MLTLVVDDSETLIWFIVASFIVHPDTKMYTGAIFTLEKGAIISELTKQKNNLRSSTESEINVVDEKIWNVLWAKNLIECQGCNSKLNNAYQDNINPMKLAKYGKKVQENKL